MKKMMLLVLGVTLVGSMAFGQVTQVLSRNAVGYVKVSVDRDKLALVRNDFVSMSSGGNTPSNLFGQTFPVGTKVWIWDNSGSKYNNETFTGTKSGNFWGPNTNLLNTGKAFWIQLPTNAPSTNYAVFIMGEVPDSIGEATTTVYLAEGLNLFGYPYPADVKWTNTDLAKSSQTGDVLYTWNGSTYVQNYLNPTKSATNWVNTNQVLNPGMGYWFKRRTGGGTITWNAVKPYTWP